MHPVESAIDYRFIDASMIDPIMFHDDRHAKVRQRLEFLGDACLSAMIAMRLFEKHPLANEGQLTSMRALLVSGKNLALLGRKLHLDKLLISPATGITDRMLAMSIEVIIGAIMLDGGDHACQAFIHHHFDASIEQLDPESIEKDPKTNLQEYCQARGIERPNYRVIATTGPAHQRQLTVMATLGDLSHQAIARNKSLAEQACAQALLNQIKDSHL